MAARPYAWLLAAWLAPAPAAAAPTPEAAGAAEAPPAGEAELEEVGLPWWVPTHARLQFAGNIGFLSAGPGWAFWERRAELALLLGHVPTFAGGPITGVALKLAVWPAELDLGGDFFARPLALGSLLHYTFGEQYFVLQPDHYPPGYYPYSTALRVAVFAGASVGMDLPGGALERIELFGEVGFTDIELVVFLDNPDSRPIYQSAQLALGLIFWF